MLDERLLDRVEAPLVRKTLDREHIASMHVDSQIAARTHRISVDEHGASTAHLEFAAHLRALEVKVIAEKVRESGTRLDRNR
jgi:hypothetical protein